MKKIILLFALCFSVNAYAVKWHPTAVTTEGNISAIDTDSIAVVNDLVVVDGMKLLKNPIKMPKNAGIIKVVETRTAFNCDKRLYAINQVVLVSQDNKMLQRSKQIANKEEMRFRPVMKNSVAELDFNYACNFIKNPPVVAKPPVLESNDTEKND